MNKIKLLTFCVIVLFLLNLATLFFLFFDAKKGKNDERNHFQPQEIIIEKLHFDENQKQEYEALIHWHRTQISNYEEQIHQTKQKLYLQLSQSEVDLKIKHSLIDNLSALQKQIETTHFKHFQDIKKICRKEQLQDYNALTQELSSVFSRKPKPRE